MGTRGWHPSQNDFMVIKYSDKFESIFYAILYGNINNLAKENICHILISKNEPQVLLSKEINIDIDQLNPQEILQSHDNKFGEINWYNNKNNKFIEFRQFIDFSFRYWHPYKYKIIIETIKQAIKYGLNYLYNMPTQEFTELINITNEIKKEMNSAQGSIKFIPLARDRFKFLIGSYREENKICDLIINLLQNKYFGYNILLRTNKVIFFLYQNQLFQIPLERFNFEINTKNFEKFWDDFYNNIFLPKEERINLI